MIINNEETMEQFASYFYEKRGIFGSYPTQQQCDLLVDLGVAYFVDLTYKIEKNKPSAYTFKKSNVTYISYPIRDQGIPNKGVDTLLTMLATLLKNGQKVYIHCKGGHGRSGLVSAMLISMLLNLSASKAIEYITRCHNQRLNLKSYRRANLQSKEQTRFLYTFSFNG